MRPREADLIKRKVKCSIKELQSGFCSFVDLAVLEVLNRDLKIRRRRVSTTAAVSWGEWGEVAVVWREKLTLTSTVEEADGFITSFRGLSVF